MTQNLLIAATAMGLGTCWVGAFNESAIMTALECPQGILPVSIVPVGFPAQSKPPSSRRSLQSIVQFIPP